MAVVLTKRRFTVTDYHLMVDAGILAEEDRVELIQGEVVEMAPIGRYHAACVRRLTQLFASLLERRVIVSVQNPVPLGTDSEPQPDIALLRPCADFYRDTPLLPADVFLLVEVADTSLAADRAVKVPLYAQAGIREAWLVDLSGDRIELHRTPRPNGYLDVTGWHRGQAVALQAFPDVTIAVEDILG